MYVFRKELVLKRVPRSVAVLGSFIIALTVFATSANAAPNKRVDIIRGQGSDTIYDLMQNLDRLYNNTVGCDIDGPPAPLDHTCFDQGTPTTKENWDHDVAMSFAPLGSGNGRDMLLQFGNPGRAKIDYARSSSAPTAAAQGLRYVAFAKDALAPVNFRGSVDAGTCDVDRSNTDFPEYDDSGPIPVANNDGTWPDGADADSCPDATVATSTTNLTLQKIKDIHLAPCTAANTWDEIDPTKPAEQVIVWTSQPGSGTRPSWDGFVGGSTDACIPTDFKDNDIQDGERVIFEHDAQPIVDCKIDPDGAGPQTINCPEAGVHYTQSIFHYGFGAHSVSGTTPPGQGADLIAVNGVAPSQATVDNGTFLFSRFMYVAYRSSMPEDNANDTVLDYIHEKDGWLCKPASEHSENTRTKNNYRTDIANVIQGTGFVPLPLGDIGGTLVGEQSHCRQVNPPS